MIGRRCFSTNSAISARCAKKLPPSSTMAASKRCCPISAKVRRSCTSSTSGRKFSVSANSQTLSCFAIRRYRAAAPPTRQQVGDLGRRWDHFFQDLQALVADLDARVYADARKVASRTRKVRDQTSRDRISRDRDDRYRGGDRGECFDEI